ncbi:DUF4054 domain-containing protein [Sphingomonas paeninsulae]|uniref:DUF4054 domain-containing protein n=1 Tax=Sphingomonas paeninsulae TaxID=2319844 RepID=A0A494TP75_SPHPE|nr:DUF4054 domain-containing protein [Sphingomonas paeninsulae]AYJ87661.1 DUF4054 domain-containing protein [Sphingomonas paeninsulae]
MTATVATFKTIFPSFVTTADTSAQYWLDRALLTTGAWDDDHASYLLTAHYLTLQGHGTGAEAELAAGGASGFTLIQSGALKLERASAKTGYASTSYGLQFLPFLRAHFGGPSITSTGSVCDGLLRGGVAGAYPWA